MPARKMRSIAKSRRAAYEGMRRRGVPKRIAAATANKGRTKAGRKAMARKAARTRGARSGRR